MRHLNNFDFVYNRLLNAGYGLSITNIDANGNFHYENVEKTS